MILSHLQKSPLSTVSRIWEIQINSANSVSQNNPVVFQGILPKIGLT